jgi:superfamily II DNA or RNA helicase
MIYELINKHWVKSAIATGDYTKTHNNEQVAKLENGEATVLVTTFELLGEGFDVQKLNRGFIALPFREKARVEQSVGRIQRTHEDKTDAILYDYVDVDIGILNNQYSHRVKAYESLGMKITG